MIFGVLQMSIRSQFHWVSRLGLIRIRIAFKYLVICRYVFIKLSRILKIHRNEIMHVEIPPILKSITTFLLVKNAFKIPS